MTRRQVMRLVLVEALIVSGLGTLLGLVAAPFISAGAAWLPVRTSLRGMAVATLRKT